MFQIIALSVALIALIVDLILTILEALMYYHATNHVGEHPGRIRGASVPAAVVMGGLRYNVKWIILDGDFQEDNMKKKKKEQREKRYQLNLKYNYFKDPELIYLLDHTENKTDLIRKLVREYYRDKIEIPF